MATGPGKYDVLTTMVREGAKARGCVVIVVEGVQGSGFSIQADPETLAALPAMLESMAKEIREDIYGGKLEG